MQIFVKGEKTHTFDILEGSSLNDLHQFISSVEGIAVDDQLLFASGHVLDEELFANLTNGCQIEVTARLLGGKVHGSLARAGKVKGQTPKVEKQVKKRKKCGRARRRILYQKRFLNTVNVPGKRRGPNTNQPTTKA